MTNNTWIIIILVLVGIMIVCCQSSLETFGPASNEETRLDYLEKVKVADENIFNFIRCINIPRTSVCKKLPGNGKICRSRQIDCNKFKLVLLNDPVAVERMKIATDYAQANPSEFTYPVRSGWMF